MEASDSRFDSNIALQILLDLAHEQSLERLLQRIVSLSVERPGIACVQAWLLEPLERSDTENAVASETGPCLRLAAGKGVSIATAPGEPPPRFEDFETRIPLGTGLLGKAALANEQVFVRNIEEHRADLAAFDWLEREKIRGCGVTPIQFKGEVLGVLVGFTRRDLPDEGRPWGRAFADHLGAAIANARAFEEIQRLKAQVELQNAYLQEEIVEAKAFGDLIGQSAALRQIVSQIDLVAPTDASVLVLGETGTGKELVAHEIHRRSRRSEGPLVRVNCASIPKDLFESEFFGHVRGAFTGAVKDRVGRFETARGGTLFLDEIGEVALEMQGKLLRVLQEKRYERIGEDRTRHADVRIIAATNRDLKQLMNEGRFREDLYYRLHVFPIHVPPLRDRKDDIPLLADHFIRLSVRELKCPEPRLTRAGIARLQNYDWPGNVRELRNVIERSVILARGGPLQFDLPGTAIEPVQKKRTRSEQSDGKPEFLTEAELLRRDRENLIAVLNAAGWRIKGRDGAAELLGVKPTTLISRMKKMGLKKPRGVL